MSGFKPSYRGIGELLTSPAMEAAMLKLAEKVKARAEGIAPVESGDYKKSFTAEVLIRRHPTARACGRISNTDPAALWIELGTSDTPRHRTLGRALDAIKGD